LGFENSVTQGIVSGLNRSIPSGGTTPALVDLIQTDAAISPGNSGGGLFDTSGQVVGINVAFIPPTEAAVSLGFAIPSVTVTDVIEQLLEEGTVEHSYMGIEPRAVTPQIASQLGLSVTEGVFVFSVSPGSPAEDAGVEPGDVIVEFDGKDITSVEDLFAALRGTSPGDSVPVRVVRGEQEQTLNVTLENRPAQ
jgi:S1-C subfamily serine protease